MCCPSFGHSGILLLVPGARRVPSPTHAPPQCPSCPSLGHSGILLLVPRAHRVPSPMCANARAAHLSATRIIYYRSLVHIESHPQHVRRPPMPELPILWQSHPQRMPRPPILTARTCLLHVPAARPVPLPLPSTSLFPTAAYAVNVPSPLYYPTMDTSSLTSSCFRFKH